MPGAHIIAGFTLGFRHRRSLVRLERETPAGLTLLMLDPEKLKADGIAGLALDFDGVLAYHGAEAPLPDVQAWLERAVKIFGADNIAILSNKPTGARMTWFALHFPGVRFVAGVRKKPYPDGLQRTGELTRVPLSSILMIDDRLLTGCLAAIAAGAVPCWINRPFISFADHPVLETFFMSIRLFERWLIRFAR